MRPLRALHVIDSLGRGGAEQMLVTLLPALAAQGCAAQVAVLRAPYDLQPALEARGIRVHRLPKSGKWNLPRRARAIARIAQEQKADIIHAHLYFPAITLALLRLMRLHPARTFVSFHNLAYAGANKAGIGLWAKRQIARVLYPLGIDQTLAVSQAVAQHYRTALGLKMPQVLFNPVEIGALPAPLSAHAPLRVVVPGRLVHEKGHQDLIQALTLLKTPVEVVFAGGGPLQETLSRSAPDIRITGPLPHAQMLQEIRSADLVVLPSRYEGFGLTAAEAMALARPVLATSAGGLPEVLGNAGVLVPPQDPGALAASLDELLQDETERQRLANAGRARAETCFATPAIAARLVGFYRDAHRKEAT